MSAIPIDVVSENRGGNKKRIDTSKDAVRFLTMHNAKGLEFHSDFDRLGSLLEINGLFQ